MREEDYICDKTLIHEDSVNKIMNTLIEVDKSISLAEFFKIFGDSTRIRIINILAKDEFCVCDIAYMLNMTQSAVSHQLKILRDSKIVKYRKVGKVVYYSLADKHVNDIYAEGLEHIEE